MLAIKQTVSSQLPTDPTREQRTWIREAAKAGARFHHDHHIPRHFASGAANRYGYVPRAKKYQRWKLRIAGRLGFRYGGRLPLILTGRTRDEITSSRQIRATSTRGATLLLRASLTGLGSGRLMDLAAVKRLQAAGKISKHGLLRLTKAAAGMTDSQRKAFQVVKELEVYTADEAQAVAREEERVYARFAGMPRLKRRLAA